MPFPPLLCNGLCAQIWRNKRIHYCYCKTHRTPSLTFGHAVFGFLKSVLVTGEKTFLCRIGYTCLFTKRRYSWCKSFHGNLGSSGKLLKRTANRSTGILDRLAWLAACCWRGGLQIVPRESSGMTGSLLQKSRATNRSTGTVGHPASGRVSWWRAGRTGGESSPFPAAWSSHCAFPHYTPTCSLYCASAPPPLHLTNRIKQQVKVKLLLYRRGRKLTNR